MKKYLFVLAAVVVAMASCKGGSGNKYTSIRFKNTEINLALGATETLNVLYEPTSLDAPVCEWSSSNSDIVSVDQKGNIEGKAAGTANITAKLGDLEAVCKVNVKDELDLINWAGWSIWNFDEDEVLSDTVDVKLQMGVTKCALHPAYAIVWDEGLIPVYNEEGIMTTLSGTGFIMEVTTPIYVIADGSKYDGYYVGSGSLAIIDPAQFKMNDTAFAYCAAAGRLGDAQKFYTYLTDTTAEVKYEECMTGVEISAANFDSQRFYYWFGLADESFIVGDEAEIQYKINVNWFENQYALKMIDTEEGKDIKQPAEWGELTPKYYEYIASANTNKDLKPMKPVKRDAPLFNKRAWTMDKDVLVRK